MSAYDKVMAARDANKITTVDYINHMFGDSFFELHGDRRYSDDKAVVAGLAMLHDMPVTVIGIEKGRNTKERMERVLKTMERVGLNTRYVNRYPHEFSGGQRQRIGIARAIVLGPKLMVCDEPVSALDVSIQAQIINLLRDLQKERGLTYLFISHDLSVVEHISDTVGVMYLGGMVESGETADIFGNPLHPYTKALFSAIPMPDPDVRKERILLKGDIPSPANPPAGCKFHTRCSECMEICKHEEPQVKDVGNGHKVKCHLYDEK